jgi:hypothetical protein
MKFYCDDARHLVCVPFSIANLHQMAEQLGIKRCWFHPGKLPHYDIPKKRIEEIQAKCERVSSKKVLQIVRST